VAEQAPSTYARVARLLADPAPLAAALLATPTSFLHGDWKMGNLGVHGDGRIVLLDWDRPSIGPVAADLAWYVAVNCDRLPESKDATLERFRNHLDRRGWRSARWWDQQLPLVLLGAFVQLGWSKAGQPEELAWWGEQVDRGQRLLT
jgi:aminoglycoside phosphotransferase (APT) family kinase protein